MLLAASRHTDLKKLNSESLFGSPHWRLQFDHHSYRVTLWISELNHHLDAVDIRGTDAKDLFWHEWGDVTLRTIFSDWHYEVGQLHYPHQSNIYFNKELQETRSINNIFINPDMKEVDLNIPQENRPADFEKNNLDAFPLGRSDRPIVEIEPGVVQIPGSWYVTMVKQPDGLVIIDAPISNGYSQKVMEEAARRYPGARIKAVIASTNFWWHIAGLREYAAHRIPIYVPQQNIPLVRRLLTSPHAIEPDSLQKSGAKPIIIGVNTSTAIGGGKNRVVLYPATQATAQMLLTWFPEYKLLHTAELAQPLGPSGSFLFPESLLELKRTVDAHGLTVDSVIGMHMSKTPWSGISEALAAASQHGESQ